jgi:hypothetical protein
MGIGFELWFDPAKNSPIQADDGQHVLSNASDNVGIDLSQISMVFDIVENNKYESNACHFGNHEK